MYQLIIMRRILLLALIAFSIQLIGQEQNLDYAKLDAYIQKSLKEHDIPGLAIGIVKGQEVVFQKGYGVKKEGETAPVTTNSMFAIASISKAFTASALGILEQEKKINFNEKVTKYLPEWSLHDACASDQFVVGDLLCHRSGLKTFDGDLLWYGTNYSRDEIISRIKHLPLTYEPRIQFGYQNIMFITAGQLIPAVATKTWDEFVTTRLLKPIGMLRTTTSIKDYPEGQDIAYPHVKGQNARGKLNPLFNYDNSGATAALNSNVVDMTKWLRLWLNDGIYDGDTIIPLKHIRRAHQVQTPLAVSSRDIKMGTNFKGYGQGWFLMDYKGMRVAHHGGGLPGYISKICVLPEEDLGFIILTNGESNLPSALMYWILDMFQGEEPKDWSKNMRDGYTRYFKSLDDERAAKIAERQADIAPSINLETLVGTYNDLMYGDAEIVLNGKGKKQKASLSLTPSKEIFSSELEHWSGDTYRIKWKDDFLPWGLVSFKKNENGKIEFTIDLKNPDFHFFNLKFVQKN